LSRSKTIIGALHNLVQTTIEIIFIGGFKVHAFKYPTFNFSCKVAKKYGVLLLFEFLLKKSSFLLIN